MTRINFIDSELLDRMTEVELHLKYQSLSKALEPLIEAIRDEDCVVAASPQSALSAIQGDKRFVDFLIRELYSPESVLRLWAAETLGTMSRREDRTSTLRFRRQIAALIKGIIAEWEGSGRPQQRLSNHCSGSGYPRSLWYA
jgi:hypothetical protein